MRTMKRRGELSQSFILSLNALEMDWEPAQRRRFARLEELRAFKEKEGTSKFLSVEVWSVGYAVCAHYIRKVNWKMILYKS